MDAINKGKRGFTLLEILLVAVIIAVIAGLAVPHFGRTYAQLQLQKIADDLAYRMRYAQSYAVTKNILVRLECDVSSRQCFLTRQLENQDAAQGSESSWERFPGRMGTAITIPEDIQFSTDDDDAFLYFHPDGTMEKRRVELCRKEECVFVSTEEQRGEVYVFKKTREE